MTPPIRFRSFQSEEGASLIEVGLLLPTLLFIVLATIDFGRGYYYANEIAGAARAGAIYGTTNPTDTTGISNAVKDSAFDMSGVSVSSSYGCECSDGTQASVSCASSPSCSGSDIVYYSKVTATATYNTLLPWTGIPASLTLSSTREMRY